jgi:hypothetical protein
MATRLAFTVGLLSYAGVKVFDYERVASTASQPYITAAPHANQDAKGDLAKRAATVTAVGASAVPLTQYAIPYNAVPYKVKPFGPPDVSTPTLRLRSPVTQPALRLSVGRNPAITGVTLRRKVPTRFARP